MSTDPERRARFEAIVSEVTAPLDRYLRRRVNTADAADVLNDTLLVVWRRLDEVPEPPLPWCYGVARRCLANARRGDRRRLRLVERIGRRRIDDQAGDPQREIDAGDPVLHAALGDLTTSEAEIVRLWAWSSSSREDRHGAGFHIELGERGAHPRQAQVGGIDRATGSGPVRTQT